MPKILRLFCCWLLISFSALTASGQTMYVDTLFSANDSLLDIYQYQIPPQYDPGTPAPLIIGWHQYGGSYNEFMYTGFAAEASLRGWIALGAWGGHGTNWTNQDAQEWMQRIIEVLEMEWSIDHQRIYVVGGSMGGASGMICANNHLDPTRPMVAATGSGSGILDDERRFLEQGNNNSMRTVFGGKPHEVPFTYHRNSAIYFADSLNSMHSNLMHVPVYLTYGSNETYHQYHALDLFARLSQFADNVFIGTTNTGHGWGVFDVTHVCDWMAQFTLNSDPDTMVISADENSRNYWSGVKLQEQEQFGLYRASRTPWGEGGILYDVSGLRNIDQFLLQEQDNDNDPHTPVRVAVGEATSGFTLGFIRDHNLITSTALLSRNGEPAWGWAEWPLNDTLSLTLAPFDTLDLVFFPEAVAPSTRPPQPPLRLDIQPAANGVQLNWGSGPATLMLYNLLGRELRRQQADVVPFLLSTQGLANGIYFVRAETEREMQIGRFIVRH